MRSTVKTSLVFATAKQFDANQDSFMTNLDKMYKVNESENRLDMIQVPAPDVLRLRLV